MEQDDRNINAKYGWVLSGERTRSKVIFLRGERWTTIAAMSTKGIIAHRTIKGAANTEEYISFFVEEV